MAGGKETPRQKLISLMYLVLMALLAMNVSKEVLNAFIKVDQSLKDTKLAVLNRNESILSGLAAKCKLKGPEDKKWLTKAVSVNEKIIDLVNYIERAKANIIEKTLDLPNEETPQILGKIGNYDTTIGLQHLKAIDNYDIPTNILGLAEPGLPKEGEYTALTIQKKVEQLVSELEILVDSPFKDLDQEIKNNIHRILDLKPVKNSEGIVLSWIEDNFYNAVLGASVVIMSDLQVKLVNTQEILSKYFYDQVGGNEIRVNSIEPVVIPKSSYVLKGDYYKAKVTVAAVDTTAKPRIQIGNTLNKLAGGKFSVSGDVQDLKDGEINIRGDRPGEYKKIGIIELKDPSGAIKQYPFETTYLVAEPTATVSATAMNVFYSGVDNPLAVSAPGFKTNELMVKATGATLKTVSNGYVARVTQDTKEANIIVAAKIDGKEVVLSRNIFRVKPLPRPTTVLNGITKDESRSTGFFKSFADVTAEIPDFLFDVKINVESFVCNIITTNGRSYRYSSNNNKITDEMRKAISGLVTGDMVIFKEVRAKMPDGSSVIVYPITITIK